MKAARTAAAALVALAALAPPAMALDIAGLSLPEQGFADTLLASSGSFTTTHGMPLATALTDGSLGSWATSGTPGAWVLLGFSDNRVVNGAGDDLALFEVGHEAYEYSQEGFDSFWITINGVSRLYATTETTTLIDDHNVNMTKLDLSQFGLAPGATIDQVMVGMDHDTRGSLPQLQLVAAIHSVAAPVPEPASAALLVAGMLALGAWRLRANAR